MGPNDYFHQIVWLNATEKVWSKFGKSILKSLYQHSCIKPKKNPDSMLIVEGWDFKNLDILDQGI